MLYFVNIFLDSLKIVALKGSEQRKHTQKSIQIIFELKMLVVLILGIYKAALWQFTSAEMDIFQFLNPFTHFLIKIDILLCQGLKTMSQKSSNFHIISTECFRKLLAGLLMHHNTIHKGSV
jgi:hypothetical protein